MKSNCVTDAIFTLHDSFIKGQGKSPNTIYIGVNLYYKLTNELGVFRNPVSSGRKEQFIGLDLIRVDKQDYLSLAYSVSETVTIGENEHE